MGVSSLRDQATDTFERGSKATKLLLPFVGVMGAGHFGWGTPYSTAAIVLVSACCLLPLATATIGELYAIGYPLLYPGDSVEEPATRRWLLDRGLQVVEWGMRLSRTIPLVGLLAFAWWVANSFGVI